MQTQSSLQRALIRGIERQLPEWAQPSNIVLRTVMPRARQRRTRLLIWTLGMVVLAALVIVSYAAQEAGDPIGMHTPRQWTLFNVLYFPLVVAQGVTLLLVLILASGALATERARGTWEAFKITSHGAETVMRARWAALFYQVRGLLALILIPRVIFTGLILVDLTEFQGFHLDLYTSGIRPEVPLEAAIVLLAAQMVVGLLLVPVLVGLNAAIGLLMSAVLVRRGPMLLARILVVAVELLGMVAAFQLGQNALDDFSAVIVNAEPMSMGARWASYVIFSTFGDQGLLFMDLRTFLQTWTDTDYGVFLGAALLGVMLLQAALTNVLLAFAARRAARPEQE